MYYLKNHHLCHAKPHVFLGGFNETEKLIFYYSENEIIILSFDQPFNQ